MIPHTGERRARTASIRELPPLTGPRARRKPHRNRSIRNNLKNACARLFFKPPKVLGSDAPCVSRLFTSLKPQAKKKSVRFALWKNESLVSEPDSHVLRVARGIQSGGVRFSHVDWDEYPRYLKRTGSTQLHFPNTKWIRDVPGTELEDDDGDIQMLGCDGGDIEMLDCEDSVDGPLDTLSSFRSSLEEDTAPGPLDRWSSFRSRLEATVQGPLNSWSSMRHSLETIMPGPLDAWSSFRAGLSAFR